MKKHAIGRVLASLSLLIMMAALAGCGSKPDESVKTPGVAPIDSSKPPPSMEALKERSGK